MPDEPGVRRLGHLVVTTGDRPGIVPSRDARVRVAEPVSGGHHAVPVGDPGAMRGSEIVRGDVGQSGRRHRRVEVRLAPLVVAQRLAPGCGEEERVLPAGQRLQVPAEPFRERRADPEEPLLM